MYWILDIGGTALKYRIVDQQYRTVLSDIVCYHKLIDAKEITKIVVSTYEQLKQKYKIMKIAISSLGIINSNTGQISGLGGIKKYHSVNWKTIFKKYAIPVFIENDANCAALHELSLNPTINNAIVLVVGTGIGGALIINHQLYKGSHGRAGEVGNGLSELKNHRYVNISQVSSTYTITNNYFKATHKKLDGYQLFERYAKDKYAQKVIDRAIYHLAKTIINLSISFDPDYVFIGGGVSSNKLFVALLKKEVKRLMKQSQLPQMFKVVQCHTHNEANLNGAMTLLK